MYHPFSAPTCKPTDIVRTNFLVFDFLVADTFHVWFASTTSGSSLHSLIIRSLILCLSTSLLAAINRSNEHSGIRPVVAIKASSQTYVTRKRPIKIYKIQHKGILYTKEIYNDPTQASENSSLNATKPIR